MRRTYGVCEDAGGCVQWRSTGLLLAHHANGLARHDPVPLVPAPRFRGHGRYTIALKALDKSGSTSAVVKKTFFR
jgi:hypothetical protein